MVADAADLKRPGPTYPTDGILIARELQQGRRSYELGGWTGYVENSLEILRTQLAAGEEIQYYSLAFRYALLGKVDQAFQELERSVEAREVNALLGLLSFPFLERLRSDPRWPELLRRAGL